MCLFSPDGTVYDSVRFWLICDAESIFNCFRTDYGMLDYRRHLCDLVANDNSLATGQRGGCLKPLLR